MTAQQPVVPPAGTRGFSLHHLATPEGEHTIAEWNGYPGYCCWRLIGRSLECYPEDLARYGWTYVGPVQPPVTEGGDG